MITSVKVDRSWLTRLFTEGEEINYQVRLGLPRFAKLVEVVTADKDMIVLRFQTSEKVDPETRIIYEQGETCPEVKLKQPMKKRLL